jgi:hypothetical protein
MSADGPFHPDNVGHDVDRDGRMVGLELSCFAGREGQVDATSLQARSRLWNTTPGLRLRRTFGLAATCRKKRGLGAMEASRPSRIEIVSNGRGIEPGQFPQLIRVAQENQP